MKLKYFAMLATFLVVAGIIRRWLLPDLPGWLTTASIIVSIVGLLLFIVYARRRERDFNDNLNRRVDPNIYEAPSHRSDNGRG